MKMLFMGRKQVAADALAWSIKNGFEIVGVLTDSHLSVSPTTEIAQRFNLPLFTYETATQAIKNRGLEFDIGVSMVYWRVIKNPILDLPKNGIINFHPAPLPEYKGTAGYNLAILDEKTEWAATTHYVDKEIDTGRIIDKFSFSIDPEQETAQTLEAKTQPFLLSLYKKTMKKILQNRTLETVENIGGTYVTRREMEQLKELKSDDDWDKKIRAFWFPPYTGAFIEKNGNKYTVINQKILRDLTPKGASSLFD